MTALIRLDATINENPQAKYQAEFANDLIPISRWYKESIRNGNGIAIEGVWMCCPALYAQVGKTNYRDESLAHLTTSDQCVVQVAFGIPAYVPAKPDCQPGWQTRKTACW